MFSTLLSALFWAVGAAATPSLYDHRSGSFSPDVVLEVKQAEFSIAGISKFSALVNGSMPGPTIRIPEDKVIWIRVYNDMEDANLTMVSHLK